MNEHAPGWYQNDGERRYWDGAQWTHATSVIPVGPGMLPMPRKEPGLAVLASFFIPGLGSMINGDVGAGVGFLAAYIFSLVFALCLGVFIIGLIGLPIALGVWIWSMIHGYQGAVRHNQLAGYPY